MPAFSFEALQADGVTRKGVIEADSIKSARTQLRAPMAGIVKAIKVGTSAYNQNCARCHGLEAISGGISPDLRMLDRDCADLKDAAKKQACYQEMDEYYVATVRRGRTRDGRVYMPPFEGILSQEAMWSIKTYLETRREP